MVMSYWKKDEMEDYSKDLVDVKIVDMKADMFQGDVVFS